MRPANTAICRISGFWDKGKKQAAPSNLSFPVPHPPAVHCSAIASRVPGSSASPFQLRLLGTGIKLAHNRIHVNTPLIAGKTFSENIFLASPKMSLRGARRRRSNPVAGDGQIAAPFGLAMTRSVFHTILHIYLWEWYTKIQRWLIMSFSIVIE